MDRLTASTLRPSWTVISLVVAIAVATMLPSAARAQRVGGSIEVSLTVLQPLATQAVRVTEFSVDRNGDARLEMTAPTRSQVSQLVMARVSSSDNEFAPVTQTPVLLRSAGVAQGLSYRVNVGRTSSATAPRDVELRVEYLAVAGT